MRIAVITSSYPRFEGDGTAPFIKSICEHLVNLGNDVEVVAPYDPAITKIDTLGVKLHRFRYIWPKDLHIMGHGHSLKNDTYLIPLTFLLLPLFLFMGFITLMRVTGKQKTEVIHAHWVLPNGLVAAWVAGIRRIPFILSLHGSDIFVAHRNPLFAAIAKWIFHKSSGVTACSPELFRAASNLGAPDNTQLIAWGADPQVFHHDKRDNELRTKYLVNQSEIIIVSIGRFVLKKGFDTLLEALAYVISEYPKVHLILGGEGPIKDDMKSLAEEFGISRYVSFIGRVPWNKVPILLATADIFVLPSKRDRHGNVDGLPTVLLEAMSCGTAVISSDIGGVGMVLENGKNGILVPPGDSSKLAESILNLSIAESTRNSLGLSARQTIEDTFNWENVSINIYKLLETVVWQHSKTFRLGSIYRLEMLKALNIKSDNGKVLDVGCHDGLLLSSQKASLLIGVDIDPIPGAPGVEFVQADGQYLPFKENSFDHVFSLDVIEHVEDHHTFAQSLKRVITPGGKLFLSTPSSRIRIFPPCLTNWVNRKWGHFFRTGYEQSMLMNLFKNGLEVRLFTWNAPAIRFWYLLFKVTSAILPIFSKKLVQKTARWDARHTNGCEGYLLLEARKSSPF